ncbi:hypothetical protein [Brevibacillus sp. SIMBA_040]|uniref:hypothetical protein n=1 Tax=unclassified Brevibacillus TaxID=2684853 RepID=UPI00397B2F9A
MDNLDELVKRIGWYTKKVNQSAKWSREKRAKRKSKLLAYKARLHEFIAEERKASAHQGAEGESRR